MRLYKPQPKYVAPEDGDIKKVKRFALLPTRVGDHIVFMEHYNDVYTYRFSFTFNRWGYPKKELID